MAATAELGPIIGLGRLELAIRECLMQPQILGLYLDEALRQTYGAEARVARPKDIVASTDERTKFSTPAIVVQAEPGKAQRMRDGSYAAQFVVGVHCITIADTHATARKTSDVMCSACTALLLQRLPGRAVGQAVVSGVEWETGVDEEQRGKTDSYVDLVAQLSVTVSGLVSDRKGRLPTMPPNTPGTTGPAPPPALPPVVVGLAVDVDEDSVTPYEPETP